ncbi:hypothetical protein BH11PLA2_BH11PLA2_23640 [soil metagenome]
MVTFPRSAARRLRLYARNSLAGRPRGPAPPVWICSTTDGIILAVKAEEVIVALHLPGTPEFRSPYAVPMEAFECVEGAGDDPVQVEWSDKDQVTLTWSDRGLPRTQSFPVPQLKPVFKVPPWPKAMASISVAFLQALHEAGRSTARQAERYALQRVQIRGQAGEIIGTDAHFVYRHEGFALPFGEDLLVPAVPLFGLDGWAKATEIHVGRTDTHVVIVADDVTVSLIIDNNGRYPDVASVFPRTPMPATINLDPEDALFLLDVLPTLPGQDDEHRQVTLDLAGPTGIVRAKAEKAKDVVEVRLPRSPVKSGPMQIAVDRRYLTRMLTLGCRTLRVFAKHRPFIASGESITTLVMPLEAELIVAASPQARVLTPETNSQPIPTRSTPMKSPEPATNSLGDGDVFDPLVEAEALRNALGEAQQRLGRLMSALRSQKKEKKAMTQVWSSLKTLNLGG